MKKEEADNSWNRLLAYLKRDEGKIRKLCPKEYLAFVYRSNNVQLVGHVEDKNNNRENLAQKVIKKYGNKNIFFGTIDNFLNEPPFIIY